MFIITNLFSYNAKVTKIFTKGGVYLLWKSPKLSEIH